LCHGFRKGHVIWAGLGRAKADFEHFFKDIPTDYLEQVEAVAMDMNASYNLLVEQYLPQATIVYDRYHMQAQFGREVIGTTRLEAVKVHRKQADQLIIQAECETQNETREMLEAQAKEEKRIASLLKKSRWTLLKNSKKLKDSEQQKLATILESHKEVAICYAMKEEMIRLYELRNEQQARDGWLNWFSAAKASGIPALVKFAQLKEKRLLGLVAHATIPISTGKLEGFNNVIKTAKRTAYGYLNNEFFLRLIRYLSLPKV
jgi:Transposase and inactivated derivatives